MRRPLTLGSLFDGIGGFPLAGKLAGMRPVWASEIEPFPIRVTEKRLPGMKHYGNIFSLRGAGLEPVGRCHLRLPLSGPVYRGEARRARRRAFRPVL